MANAELIETISGFMSRAFEGREIRTDEDIFEAGFGTSMFAMQLVNFIERKFGIEIESEDLEMDNFRTIERVAALVERKRMVSGPV